MDVCVYLKGEYCINDYCTDEYYYLIEVTTAQFLSTLIEEFESGFLSPDYPYIIVSKLTDEIVHSAIQSYLDTEDDAERRKTRITR